MQQDNRHTDVAGQAASVGENGKLPWTQPVLLTLGEADDVMNIPGARSDGGTSS
jgi:hypothetical protein